MIRNHSVVNCIIVVHVPSSILPKLRRKRHWHNNVTEWGALMSEF